jgi:hypothetical protein
MLLLPKEQMGEALESSKKQCSFENGAALDGKVFSFVSVFEQLSICGLGPEVTEEYSQINLHRHGNNKHTRT